MQRAQADSLTLEDSRNATRNVSESCRAKQQADEETSDIEAFPLPAEVLSNYRYCACVAGSLEVVHTMLWRDSHGVIRKLL